MFCKYCGAQLRDNAKFCETCGKPVEAQPAAQGQTHAAAHSSAHAQAQPAQPQAEPANVYSAQPLPGAQGAGTPQRAQQKRGGCLKFLVLAVIAVIVLVLVGGLLFGGSGDGSGYDSGAGSTEVLDTSESTQGNQDVTVSQYGTGIYGTDLKGVSFRDNYTKLLGDGKDTVTLMVYMVGADLESESGCATMDLQEMLNATQGDKLNVVVQTGGCSYWHNNLVSAGEVQRWNIRDGNMQELENLGSQSMLTADSVTDFIQYSVEKYPASRYMLVFWDHGGGSLYGYGSDETFPDDVLYLPDIAQALKDTDVKFDLVGFDACLMGSLETAYMLEPYADYLIGSEETEPGYGWDYTGWMTYLGENPSVDTVDLGVHIIDEFRAENSKADTLSIVSLREISHVYDTLGTCMQSAESELSSNGEFRTLTTARANAKSFADAEYDMIDLVDFADAAKLDGTDDLVAAVDSAVKYRTNSTVAGTNGLSMYFPYSQIKVYSYAKDYFGTFGFGGTCYEFYDNFVSMLAGGQQRSTGRSMKSNLTGQADTPVDYTQESWYNAEAANSVTASDEVDYTELAIQQSGDNWILPLSDDQWNMLTGIELQVLLDDGSGYIDLGSDQTFETTENDDLLISFDNTWVALDGHVVPYYAEQTIAHTGDDGSTFVGYVPALLNGDKEIEIVLQWDSTDADAGYVAGYRYAQNNGAFGDGGTQPKGLMTLKEGDKLQFECDYYTYDGTYDASYLLGDPITVGKEQPKVTYEDVGKNPVLVSFMLTDLYQNHSWTETVQMS